MLSPNSGLVAGIIGIILLLSIIFVPGIRLVVIRLIGYTIFTAAITIRFYILLPIGLFRAFSYFIFGEITDLLSGDNDHVIIKITRAYLPRLFLIQLQRYNGLGDQVPAISVLLLRYFITIIVYAAAGILYLWLKAEYKFINIHIERFFIVIALGIVINIFSSSLYYIISALSKPESEPVEVKTEELPKLNTSMLYSIGKNANVHKSGDIMNIYKSAAPVLARMQRTDLNLKPFYIAYRKGLEDFYQYENGFNIMELIRVVNELPVIDEMEGMIDYCIYYKDGKNFHKTDYMTRERLKILVKAVYSIYINWDKK